MLILLFAYWCSSLLWCGVPDLAVPPETKRGDAHGGGPRKEDDGAIEVKIPVKHVLSRELQLYFEKITELIVAGSDTLLLRDAFLSVATDSGLHPLVPYFTQFVADEVCICLFYSLFCA
jgi:transcription initiation factor TFIID subunit 6